VVQAIQTLKGFQAFQVLLPPFVDKLRQNPVDPFDYAFNLILFWGLRIF
jgi:hypothetical protein